MHSQSLSPSALHALHALHADAPAIAIKLIATFGRATGIFSPRHVSESLGLSLPTLWRMRQRGEFPDPIQLSPGRKGYTTAVLAEWLESRNHATDDRAAIARKPPARRPAKARARGRTKNSARR